MPRGYRCRGHGQRLKLLTYLSNFKGEEGTVNQPSDDFVCSSPTSPTNENNNLARGKFGNSLIS
jgi:hypothetical protein